jgi:hypothetical protein
MENKRQKREINKLDHWNDAEYKKDYYTQYNQLDDVKQKRREYARKYREKKKLEIQEKQHILNVKNTLYSA